MTPEKLEDRAEWLFMGNAGPNWVQELWTRGSGDIGPGSPEDHAAWARPTKGSMAGQILSSEETPRPVEIMDTLSDPHRPRKAVVIKSARVGYTAEYEETE